MHGNVKWDNEKLIAIMTMRINGETLQQIADKYGCSRENIRQIIGRGMRIMEADSRYNEIVFPNIRDRMLERRITVYQLAKDTGVSYNSLAMWLKGRHDLPLRKALVIARFLGMTVDEAFALPESETV